MLITRILNILHLAVPGMVSSVSGLATILVCTRILGNINASNYYLLAVFLPINYVMIAIYESMRAASLALSAKAFYQKNWLAIGANVAGLVLMSAMIFGVLLVIFLCFGFWLASILGVASKEMHEFFYFSSSMIISGWVTCMAYIFSSTFFAMRKPVIGMLLAVFSAVLTCLFTYMVSKFISPAWLSYSIGCASAAFFSSFLAVLFLSRFGVSIKTIFSSHFFLAVKNINSIVKVSFPVLFSCMAIFSSLFFINATLSHFSSTILTGFSIAYRIQNIIILPAITIGTAIAVLSSGSRIEDNSSELVTVQFVGVAICFLLYLFLAVFVYFFRELLVSFVTSNTDLIKSGATYLKYVSLTYAVMGPNLACLTALEQSGLGFKSFLINIAYFVIAIGIGCFASLFYHQYTYLYVTVAGVNILIFLYFIGSIFFKRASFLFNKSKVLRV